MKKLIIVLFISLPAIGFGQNMESKSKIKLIDGSVLNVTIVENIIDDYIRIKLPGGEIVKIDYNKIESIKHTGFSYKSSYMLPTGFYTDGSFNVMIGRTSLDSDFRTGISLGASANYRFNSFFSTGLGVESIFMLVNGQNISLPVYARISGNLIKKKVAPLYFIDAGWAFPLAKQEEVVESEGGWFVRPGVGIQFDHFSLKFGFQAQRVITTTELPNWWGWGGRTIREEDRVLRNITIGASYSF
ncbi:MAG: hypothetical protein ABFS32_20485 [Bacteroidota bacterium]